MPFHLQTLKRRYQLAEAVSLDIRLQGAHCLDADVWLERGIVAVLSATLHRPQLVVLRSYRGGWWFVGVQSGPWLGQDWTRPFLVGLVASEHIEQAEERLEQQGW